MEYDIDETEYGRPAWANLVTTWVLAAMLLILTAFVSQFPEAERLPRTAIAGR